MIEGSQFGAAGGCLPGSVFVRRSGWLGRSLFDLMLEFAATVLLYFPPPHFASGDSMFH